MVGDESGRGGGAVVGMAGWEWSMRRQRWVEFCWYKQAVVRQLAHGEGSESVSGEERGQVGQWGVGGCVAGWQGRRWWQRVHILRWAVAGKGQEQRVWMLRMAVV